MNLKDICCEDRWWIQLARDRVCVVSGVQSSDFCSCCHLGHLAKEITFRG